MTKKRTTPAGVKGDRMPNDLITQKEAADLKGVSVSAVTHWVRRGRVRAFEQYSRRLVSRAEVLAYQPEVGRPRKSE
ncbi:MAG: helix-turn-helix domain-containing protein [Pyrinomonadaceae bacterium]